MSKYGMLGEVTEEYFREHPEEIENFLTENFEEYVEDGDSAALRIIARVKSVSALAEEIGMTRHGLQKALSSKGNPRLDNINSIMRAMGYRLCRKRWKSLLDRNRGLEVSE